jgi:hypothetical protein
LKIYRPNIKLELDSKKAVIITEKLGKLWSTIGSRISSMKILSGLRLISLATSPLPKLSLLYTTGVKKKKTCKKMVTTYCKSLK